MGAMMGSSKNGHGLWVYYWCTNIFTAVGVIIGFIFGMQKRSENQTAILTPPQGLSTS
jgi:hypothetical protein